MKNFKPLKDLLHKYRHIWVLSYFIVYLIWFLYLEYNVTTSYTSVHITLDDYIPFCELFVIPYYLWFAYIFITVAYFFFTSKTEFYQLCANLFIGMSICLVIYTIWPNGQDLRPNLYSIGRDNLFIDIVKRLYSYDTHTNVCPSIHVFNSIAACIAIVRNKRLSSIAWTRYGSIILTILISLSTCFLKQHSALDVLTAILLSFFMYVVVYVPKWSSHRYHKA